MDNPPHVNGPLLQTLLVTGETVDIFGHQQGLLGCRRLSHSFFGDNQKRFFVSSDWCLS